MMQEFLKLSAVPYILFCLLNSSVTPLPVFSILLSFCLTCEGIETCPCFPLKEQDSKEQEQEQEQASLENKRTSP